MSQLDDLYSVLLQQQGSNGGLADRTPYSPQGSGGLPEQYYGVSRPLPPGYGADNYGFNAMNPMSPGALEYLKAMIALHGEALDNADPSQNTYLAPQGRGPTNDAQRQMGILGLPYSAFVGSYRR